MAGVATNIGNAEGRPPVISGATVPAKAAIYVITTEIALAADPTSGTVSDSVGNTYTKVAFGFANSQLYSAVWQSITGNAIASGSIAYNISDTGNYAMASALYATGLATGNPFDSATLVSVNFTSSAASVTSGVPALPNELFIAAVGWWGDTLGFSIGSGGWSSPFSVHNAPVGGNFQGVAGGNQLNTGLATKTFSPGISGTAFGTSFVFGLKPPPTPKYFQLKTRLRR